MWVREWVSEWVAVLLWQHHLPLRSSAPALEEKNCDPLSVIITSKLDRRFYRPGLVSMGPLPPTDSASSTTLWTFEHLHLSATLSISLIRLFDFFGLLFCHYSLSVEIHLRSLRSKVSEFRVSKTKVEKTSKAVKESPSLPHSHTHLSLIHNKFNELGLWW
jgi:hypothetical protein